MDAIIYRRLCRKGSPPRSRSSPFYVTAVSISALGFLSSDRDQSASYAAAASADRGACTKYFPARRCGLCISAEAVARNAVWHETTPAIRVAFHLSCAPSEIRIQDTRRRSCACRGRSRVFAASPARDCNTGRRIQRVQPRQTVLTVRAGLP